MEALDAAIRGVGGNAGTVGALSAIGLPWTGAWSSVVPAPGVPLTAALAGTRLTAGVLFAPSAADAGSVAVGSRATTRITVTNSADLPVTPAAATLASVGWTISSDGCAGSAPAAAAACAIDLVVAPTAVNSAGTARATSRLTAPVRFALKGRARR